jgi:CysZ protein
MSISSHSNFAVNFARGFFSPFHSVRLLRRNPGLIRYILIPFVINLLVFALAATLGLSFFDQTVTGLIPQGEAWYWALLYGLLWSVAVVLTMVLVFFSFTVVGNLLASPFNDLLSERTEQVCGGAASDQPFALGRFCHDAWQTILLEVKKLSLFVVVMLLILPLNLLPAIGSLIYSVLSIGLMLFFLCFEYLSFVMVRKQLFFAEQRRYIMTRKFLMLGFSCGVLVLLAIPLLQLFCIPLAVIAATRLWCEESGLSGSEPGAQAKDLHAATGGQL